MLCKTANKQLKLKDLNSACKGLKKIEAVKAIFVKQCDVQSWEEALQKFPIFTNEKQLEQFTDKPITTETPPPGLIRLCKKALMSLQTIQPTSSADKFVSVTKKGESVAILINKKPEALSSEDITGTVPTFHGISLSIIYDKYNGTQVQSNLYFC